MSRIIPVVGVLLFMVGLALVLPQMAQWRMDGAIYGDGPILLMLGTAMTVCGAGAVLRTVTRLRTFVPGRRGGL